jgi:hypothetical protein
MFFAKWYRPASIKPAAANDIWRIHACSRKGIAPYIMFRGYAVFILYEQVYLLTCSIFLLPVPYKRSRLIIVQASRKAARRQYHFSGIADDLHFLLAGFALWHTSKWRDDEMGHAGPRAILKRIDFRSQIRAGYLTQTYYCMGPAYIGAVQDSVSSPVFAEVCPGSKSSLLVKCNRASIHTMVTKSVSFCITGNSCR